MDDVKAAIISKQKFLTLVRQVRTAHFEKGSMD